MFRFDTPQAHLRSVAFLEGLSYVLLLFVAMPLKYAAGMPQAVRVVGSAHGALFVWLMALLGLGLRRGETLAWAVKIGIASLLPFGTFFLDRSLREAEEASRRSPAGS